VDRVDADRHAMLSLHPVPPVTGWRHSMRLSRDHYLRFDSNDYSVNPVVIGRRIRARADLDRLQMWCEGRLVADHQRSGPGTQTVSEFDHLIAGRLLRRNRVEVLHPVKPRLRSAIVQTTPARWDSSPTPLTEPPDAGRQGRDGQPGSHRRTGVPDSGAEGAHVA
jgi:hypothetical protein